MRYMALAFPDRVSVGMRCEQACHTDRGTRERIYACGLCFSFLSLVRQKRKKQALFVLRVYFFRTFACLFFLENEIFTFRMPFLCRYPWQHSHGPEPERTPTIDAQPR